MLRRLPFRERNGTFEKRTKKEQFRRLPGMDNGENVSYRYMLGVL